jgi:hypothetical protein
VSAARALALAAMLVPVLETAAPAVAGPSPGRFNGWIVVTSDPDWKAKWEKPGEAMPPFTEVRTVPRNGHAHGLIFFQGPELTGAGNAKVNCDIDLIRPNGSSSIHEPGTLCFLGPLENKARGVYLADPVIEFTGEAKDPPGEWQVRVTLKDAVSHVEVPLKASFVLRE